MRRTTAFIPLALAIAAASTGLQAEVQTKTIEYEVNGNPHTGYIAWDDAIEAERPGVLVVHEWWGHDQFSRDQAEKLAQAGYTAMAVDMYGEGKSADHPEKAKAFMKEANSDMEAMKTGFRTAMKRLQDHETVDPDRIAAQGYCFGGAVVLNMARMGLDLDGVVSYHGSLASPIEAEAGDINARIQVYAGNADQFVPAEQVGGFVQEMHAADAEYMVKSFPGVQHSFMNPKADQYAEEFSMPMGYDEEAANAAWEGTMRFYEDIF
jgi:dienelactone hydrolase